jgi:hypothetical protein
LQKAYTTFSFLFCFLSYIASLFYIVFPWKYTPIT